MKVILSWLKEFVDCKESPEEISQALTLAGLEEEGMEEVDGDVIFEIGLTPNLGHCMSLFGMARELSAILNLPLREKLLSFKESGVLTSELISVSIEAKEECLSYSCRLVQSIAVGPSPDWLVDRLERSGLRSVNNVVDIGNFVMYETGQPLHMFDYDKLQEKEITVKMSDGNESMVTLDNETRVIPKGALLIADGKKAIAFAGVIGEESSAVTDSTKNVLIEAAHFTPQSVRKTSKLLNLRTDSSARFERGIDPLRVEYALDYAAQLLTELAQGEICTGIVRELTAPYIPHILELSPKRTNQILGTELSIHEMSSLLERLEIKVLSETPEKIKVEVPSYRNDLRAEIDLIEEVGRMYGFNNIPRKRPRHSSSSITHAPLFLIEEESRAQLVAQGLQECLTCDLISPKLSEITLEKALDKEALIHVLHPASIDQSVLRPSLLPGLLEVIKFNIDRQNTTIAAFEVGHIHFKQGEETFGEPAAGIILTGLSAPYHHDPKAREVDFFHLKGHVENFLTSIGIEGVIFSCSHLQNFHPGRQATAKIGDSQIAALGEVLPQHLRSLGISQRVYYAELNLHDLLRLERKQVKAKALPAYPGSERDWTITLSDRVLTGDVLDEISLLESPLLEKVTLLGLYKSEKIGKDRKNVTFRFLYRDLEKTIEAAEVEKEHKRITTTLAEKLKDSVG
ncbi:MAG: Phenylalanine--tRNA ligase beta subunit [Chlamydiae bacterium]|nr:Phenylalanine--tRNA ligase beta subunit [Chlamydiota bacterium]